MVLRCFSQISSPKLNFDIIIVGSGPAGLSIATELLGSGLNVAVLESGDTTRSASGDELNAFEQVGQTRAPHAEVSCRGFGGTSALWTGRCGAFDPIDYARRPWLPGTGWPIGRETLAPYYQRAGRFLGLAPTRSAEKAQHELGKAFDTPPFASSMFKPVIWQFSKSNTGDASDIRHFTPEGDMPGDMLQHTGAPTSINVGERHRAELEASETVQILTSATVTEILTTPDQGQVCGVQVMNDAGASVEIAAPRVVLACGGIQTPRLLLASRSRNPAGLGNAHDQVGRYLADHHFTEVAAFDKGKGTQVRKRLGNRWHPRFGSHHVHCLGLRLSDDIQREQGLLNAALHLAEFGSEVNPLSTLARGLRGLKGGTGGLADVAAALRHPYGLATSAHARLVTKVPPLNRPDRSVVGCVVEQELQPDSRVSLSDQTDRFGVPLARIDWRISEREYQTVRAVENAFHLETRRLGIDDAYQRPAWLEQGFDAWRSGLLDLAHPACSARMALDPSDGVVDVNCQVHGVEGLFIAGSSVFPTNSHMNPTQTLVALSLRLADHIHVSARKSAAAAVAHQPDRCRVGFVGGGDRVRSIYAPAMQALSHEADICGAVTASDAGAERLADLTGWSVGTDLDALIRDKNPELLIVAVPPDQIDWFYPVMADRGIPLLLETPFCWNERAGRKLLSKIENHNALVGIAEQFPFLPEIRLQKKMISLGLIGDITSVVNDFAVFDYHGIGLMRELLGRDRQPQSAQAVRSHMVSDECWMRGTVTFDDGSFFIHRFSPDYEKSPHRNAPRMITYGSSGTLLPGEARFAAGTGPAMVSTFQRFEDAAGLKAIRVEMPDGVVEWTNPLAGHNLNDEQIAVGCLVQAMVRAVRDGGEPAYPAWAGLEDVEILNALGYSADRGGARIGLPASRLFQRALIKTRNRLAI